MHSQTDETIIATGTENSDKPNAGISRRAFLARSAIVTAVAGLSPALLARFNKAEAGNVLPDATILETLSGVLAFVVPGADPFSVQQGITSATPGAVEANAAAPLAYGLNIAGLAPPPYASLSELISAILNGIASQINPNATGPFSAPFANLSYAEKAFVFSLMESGAVGPGLGAVVNSLLLYAGLMSFSEAGVFDPFTRTLVAPPVGWAITGYDGISDGRKDFKGYYLGRKSALP